MTEQGLGERILQNVLRATMDRKLWGAMIGKVLKGHATEKKKKLT